TEAWPDLRVSNGTARPAPPLLASVAVLKSHPAPPNAPLDEGRHYKQFKKSVFELDYEILDKIFNNNTTSGQLRHAFTKEPSTSDEEKLLERKTFF
ncbi:hypothetical protein PIB30_058397, partial [Stylosanthes scabra]|nr:hypothetical protein [Stylosanthes scabra]